MKILYEDYGVGRIIGRAFNHISMSFVCSEYCRPYLNDALRDVLAKKNYPTSDIEKYIKQLNELIDEKSFWFDDTTQQKDEIITQFKKDLQAIPVFEFNKTECEEIIRDFIKDKCTIECEHLSEITQKKYEAYKSHSLNNFVFYNQVISQEFLFIITKLKYQKNIIDIRLIRNVIVNNFVPHLEIDSDDFYKFESKRDELIEGLVYNLVSRKGYNTRKFLINIVNLKKRAYKDRSTFSNCLSNEEQNALIWNTSIYEGRKKADTRSCLKSIIHIIAMIFILGLVCIYCINNDV